MRRTPTTAARRTPTTTDDVVAARAARTTGQAAAPAAADASVWGRLGESGAAGSATTRHAHTGTAGARDHSLFAAKLETICMTTWRTRDVIMT